MLRDGEIALLADGGGLDTVSGVAHELGLFSIALVRSEQTPQSQDDTVIAHAQALPLVWVGENFSETASAWAHERGPMTLLIETGGALSEDERRRIDRFVAILGRQSE
jgi:hypothetical protein